VYKEDSIAQLAAKDLVEWIEYMRYAGVQRFYMIDCYWPENSYEQLRNHTVLKNYIDKGYIHYSDWSARAKPLTLSIQVDMYYEALNDYGRDAAVWRSHVDSDEYPFVPGDTDPGFLVRYLAKQPKDRSVITLSNNVFGGTSTGPDHVNDTRAARYLMRIPTPTNGLSKYLFRPANIETIG
jgi:hypothetical protein